MQTTRHPFDIRMMTTELRSSLLQGPPTFDAKCPTWEHLTSIENTVHFHTLLPVSSVDALLPVGLPNIGNHVVYVLFG